MEHREERQQRAGERAPVLQAEARVGNGALLAALAVRPVRDLRVLDELLHGGLQLERVGAGYVVLEPGRAATALPALAAALPPPELQVPEPGSPLAPLLDDDGGPQDLRRDLGAQHLRAGGGAGQPRHLPALEEVPAEGPVLRRGSADLRLRELEPRPRQQGAGGQALLRGLLRLRLAGAAEEGLELRPRPEPGAVGQRPGKARVLLAQLLDQRRLERGAQQAHPASRPLGPAGPPGGGPSGWPPLGQSLLEPKWLRRERERERAPDVSAEDSEPCSLVARKIGRAECRRSPPKQPADT